MKQRGILAGVIAGLVAIIAVPVLIFAYGRSDPSPPSLADDPNVGIPGEVLFFDEDGCVVRAKASGEDMEIATCELATRPDSFVTWVDGDTIAVAQNWPGPAGTSFQMTTLDLRTGSQGTATATVAGGFVPYGPSSQASVHGERVSIDQQSGEVTILAGAEKRVVKNFDVPEYRGPQFLTWSPDGEWMLLAYYDDDEQELWVLSRDGQTAGTLAKGLRQPVASWYIDGLGAWPVVTIEP